MGVLAAVRTGFNGFLDLLYPPRCGGCGQFGAGWWCKTCDAQLKRLDAAQSAHVIATATGSLTVISAALFAPPLREAIHAFKYEGTPQLAPVFATHMAEAWRDANLTAELIVPVPLHPSRLRERGFNQSEQLARRLSKATGIVMSANGLARTHRTEQQVNLTVAERKSNVAGAFSANAAAVSGRRILLVDDVLTSGATLAECAGALWVGGAPNVVALTLARAQS